MKPAEVVQKPETLHPLASDGGVIVKSTSTRDPYEVLDDLMAVVEALCPKWPSRETFKTAGSWLL